MQQSAIYGTRGLLRIRAVLAAAMATALALTMSTAARAATIIVNSLANSGASGICTLRDAITAANTMKAVDGCVAGTGHDTIRLLVTGTIQLNSTLPQVTRKLTIKGDGITLDGRNAVQVMQVASGATLILNNLTIAHGNNVSGNGEGGGIYNDGTLMISDSVFSENNAGLAGGGITNEGTATVNDSTFSDNFGGMGGGGVANGGTMTIIDSTFTGNATPGGGGGIVTGNGIEPGGTMTIIGCTFSGNNATDGGAIENNGGALTVINSTFFENGAAGAGGIDSVGTLTVTNSTFLDNETLSDGAAVLGVGSISLKSTILAGSTISGIGGPAANCAGTIIDAGYNISDDASCGFSAAGSQNSSNPMLDPEGLENNGGPTQTISLVPGSPAIDAIPLGDCTDQASHRINTDQRGALRPDAGEARCDIGAYEFQDLAGRLNCHGNTVSALGREFRDLHAAAAALGFTGERALLNAIRTSCGG